MPKDHSVTGSAEEQWWTSELRKKERKKKKERAIPKVNDLERVEGGGRERTDYLPHPAPGKRMAE